MKYLIVLLIIICFYGCETKVGDNTSSGSNETMEKSKAEPDANPIIQRKIKGMYESKDNKGIITDCESGSLKFVDGDIKDIDSVYSSVVDKNTKKKLYIIAEGFNSVKENSRKRNFDTVFVITNLIAIDTVFDCLK